MTAYKIKILHVIHKWFPHVVACLSFGWFVLHMYYSLNAQFTILSCVNIFTDDEDLVQATNILCARYTKNRFIQSVDDWPPYCPKHYTPLNIVRHGLMRTESEVEDIAQKMNTTNSWTDTQCSNVCNKDIKNVEDLFMPFKNITSYIILIEGAPGIGKTELAKEIALQWASNSILSNKKLLFLLFMRDPKIKGITNLQLLVKYFYHGDTLSNNITDWLLTTDGKHLTIIFDGYDEMSADSKHDSIIYEIIMRQILTQCSIVITSHPIASSCFHDMADCRAEVLGFTEKDREDFINNALQGEDHKIKKLGEYLLANQRLNMICYVPLNMSFLLCLAKGNFDKLPKTQTVLYKNFILMTITHFLVKDKLLPTTSVTKFTDVPPPYDQMINELSQFAFLALQKDQLVFTLAEIRAECPNLTPVNWYRLGLLKSVKYFKPQDGGDHESFRFLHYSIQEYMAAYYIASLPGNELLSLLKKTFWNAHYFNTWVMYVGITGGKHHAFTHFLSGNSLKVTSWLSTPKSISKKILNDKIKCLHLLQCSAEADCEILSSVEKIFRRRIIDLSNTTLSIDNMRTLAVLLLSLPSEEWELLNLSRCDISNSACNVFCERFCSQRITSKIKKLDISYNKLHWESLSKLCEFFELWQTEELFISIDALYDSTISEWMDNPFELVGLTSKSSPTIIHSSSQSPLKGKGLLLCTYMAEAQRLIFVHSQPENYYIACYQLAASNHTLLSAIFSEIGLNRVAIKYSYNINYLEAIMKSAVLSRYVQKIVFFGSNMHSKGAYIMNVPLAIHYCDNNKPHEIVADYLTAFVCHNIQTNCSYYKNLPASSTAVVNNTLEKISNLQMFKFSNNNIDREMANDIAVVLTYTNNLQRIDLSKNNLQSAGAITIAKALKNTKTLISIDLSSNNISEEAADDIAAVLSQNIELQILDMGVNHLQTTGVIKIMRALHSTVTITSLCLSKNDIRKEAADNIATVLSHNTKLQELKLANNDLQSAGAIKIAQSLCNTATLTAFDLSSNSISKEAADDIATVLSYNTKLQVLHLSGNNLQSAGAIKIAGALHDNVTLISFGMSDNNINEEAADDIATILSHNTAIQEVYMHGNNLRSVGAIKIAKALDKTKTLISLDLDANDISEEAADDIALVLSHNYEMKTIKLGTNNFQLAGIVKIMRALHNSINICVFDLSNNNIDEDAADSIAAVLSHNTKLSLLHLGRNNLQSAGAIKISKALHSTMTLKMFALNDNNINEEAADDIAAVLFHNILIQEIDMSGNNLRSVGAIMVAKALHKTKTLISLDLSANDISEEAADDIAMILSHNCEMKTIKLGTNNFQSAGAIKIAKALHSTMTLKIFALNDNNINEEAADDIAAVLFHSILIQEIDMSGNNLRSVGAIKIAKALDKTKTLISLDLSANDISEEAADDIATILSHNVEIQNFKLAENNLHSAGAIKIAKALHNTITLISFNLSGNDISEEAAESIATVLSHNTKLQTVRLGGNSIHSVGAIKIAKALHSNTSLTDLDLSSNNISEVAADDIALVLSHNTKIQNLHLAENNLQSAGAIKIAKALHNTLTLISFDLSGNNINEEAVDDIATVLSQNTKLKTVKLSRNDLKSEGAIKIARNLQSFESLTWFDISNNNISEETFDVIMEALSHNTKLHKLCLK